MPAAIAPGYAIRPEASHDESQVDALFKRATDAGTKVKMPLGDMFWGDRMGTVVDAWGNEWSLAQRTRDMTPEEMKKAADAFIAQMAHRKP